MARDSRTSGTLRWMSVSSWRNPERNAGASGATTAVPPKCGSRGPSSDPSDKGSLSPDPTRALHGPVRSG